MKCVCDPDRPVYGAACGHHSQMCRDYAASLGLETHSGLINVLDQDGKSITREEAIDLIGRLHKTIKELKDRLERIEKAVKS